MIKEIKEKKPTVPPVFKALDDRCDYLNLNSSNGRWGESYPMQCGFEGSCALQFQRGTLGRTEYYCKAEIDPNRYKRPLIIP
jgi:hypothetical protein